MKIEDLYSVFQIEDLKDLPQAVMLLLEGDKEKRDAVYCQLIAMNSYDLSYDWFQPLYEPSFQNVGRRNRTSRRENWGCCAPN